MNLLKQFFLNILNVFFILIVLCGVLYGLIKITKFAAPIILSYKYGPHASFFILLLLFLATTVTILESYFNA